MPDLNTDGSLSVLLISSVFLAFPAWAGDVEVQLGAGDGFVVEDNTGAIERLRVDEATGNISRNDALFVHTTGANNTFVGEGAGNTATSGQGFNSAFGKNALQFITTARQNTAMGAFALWKNTTGQQNTAVGEGTLRENTTGNDNIAIGVAALLLNTTGTGNIAIGTGAMLGQIGSSGNLNTAVGRSAIGGNTTGFRNAAFGNVALQANTTGGENSAVGFGALRNNTTGERNTAIGNEALSQNTTGNDNITIGNTAGKSLTSGNDNVYVANLGTSVESNTIRIGSTHTRVFIAGINGVNVGESATVFVNASGQLGTSMSSRRFKEEIRDMGGASDGLMELRPVMFRYKEDFAPGDRSPQPGLIAEEVAEVAPELVTYDDEGQPYSVRYHMLPAMLLNEVQKQQRTLEAQKARIGVQAAAIESQTAQLAEQQERIAAVLARIEHLEARPQLAWVEPIR